MNNLSSVGFSELDSDETLNINGGLSAAGIIALAALGLFLIGSMEGCAKKDQGR
ncbi:hypothetical protein [Amphibacillus xylanus]|uniref:Class IIb bacteriocin, lactobin A/cerein 7B family n=1 Tax=Amphibacillus xylanus (strain ATCC 51415 / DSM 6626 / JCM 7361 / LMG 17667 / NBRC 15112 / Ep01) TaxID=698758 RepID=K0IWJ1_AMPXN|nr:hypothetical protein [Amphibacillus xylanus]BAM46845.1 hypothetical protein AXY_07130 [Amphibacillus xylanus NBRC 15112]